MRVLRVTDGTATVVLLADRHARAPRGAAGGGDGALGRHALLRDGVETALPAKTAVRLQAGDAVVVQTPGGGGYGESEH